MRKRFTSLASACAVAAGLMGLAGSAQALVSGSPTLAPIDGFTVADRLVHNVDDIGHMLVVPYFTVNNGNDTYLSIQNTDMRNGKAVKVRFRGAGNSDDIFDFTLFLSPGDIWTAAVTQHSSGVSMLRTADSSCTLPSTVGKGTGTLFVTARLPGSGDAQAAGTREGYVEIFNMADVPPVRYTYDPATFATTPGGTANALFTAIKHPANAAPPCTGSTFNTLNPVTNPSVPWAAVTDTAALYTQTLALGLLPPTTGLRANWVIINPQRAAAWTGNAYAIEARTAANQPGFGNIVFYPQTSDNVAIADVRLATSDPILRGGVVNMTTTSNIGTPSAAPVQAAMYDFPDMSTPYVANYLALAANGAGTRLQAFNLTNALAASSISNEYYLEPALNARTDWVFSLPTRRYNVARDYSGSGSNIYTNYRHDDTSAPVADPVTTWQLWNFFSTTNVATNAAYPNILCVGGVTGQAGGTGTPTARLTSGQTGDREENFMSASSEFVVSPGTPGTPFSICGEVAVMSFNEGVSGSFPYTPSSVLGGSITRFGATGIPYANGWTRIATPGLNAGVANSGLISFVTGDNMAGYGAGLPVIGYMASLFTVGQSGNTIGNYNVTYPHGRTRYAAH